MSVRLPEWELRAKFNGSGIWARALAGTYHCVRTVRDPTPDNKQPPGTLSVTTSIYDPAAGKGLLGKKVAITHHYEDPNGSILNGAGLPDPKMVRIGNEMYVLGVAPPKPPPTPKSPPPPPATA